MSANSVLSITAVLSLQTISTCITSTIGQYIYAFYLQIYSNSSNGTSNYTIIRPMTSFQMVLAIDENTTHCVKDDTSPNDNAQVWAQQRSADLFFWTNLCSCCPVIVMTYILGLYTPKLGKRFVLILTMIGMIGQLGIWLLIIYLHLSEYWWYIASTIVGLSGSTGVLTFVLNLIITENTDERNLSSRFVSLGAIQTALASVVTLGIGYYIRWRGFTDLYWSGLALQFLSILIVLISFRETNSIDSERQPLLTATTTSPTDEEKNEFTSTRCGHFFQVCTVFRFNRRSTKKSTSLLLTLFANFFYAIATATFAPYLWFLLNAPFCWTSTDIGNYSAVASISYAILSVLGMKALTSIGACDAMICLISHVFFGASSLWLAFAQHSWELYAGLILSAFSGYQGSLTMSMMSKWLEPHERSNAFTLVTEMNTIVASTGVSFFNWVYARTVIHLRTFTLFLGVGLSLIPLILNLCLWLITRNMSEEDLPPLSETDTEPTPLHLLSNVPLHAGDAACIVIPSRSLTASMRTPSIGRSRTNSLDIDPTQIINNDPIIL